MTMNILARGEFYDNYVAHYFQFLVSTRDTMQKKLKQGLSSFLTPKWLTIVKLQIFYQATYYIMI